jgi:heme exporter protein A
MRLIGERLACQRGDRTVFTDLGLELGEGELLVLTGPNGTGKTSLLRMIAGLIEPAAGSLMLHGSPPELTIGQQCHLVAHQDALKPALTAVENLRFWGDFLGHGDVAAALSSFDLVALGGLQAELLSAGQKRRLALSRLALTRRSLWLLDEPTVGLDHASQGRLANLMAAHLDHGGLVIVTTHVDIGLRASQRIDLGDVAVAGP